MFSSMSKFHISNPDVTYFTNPSITLFPNDSLDHSCRDSLTSSTNDSTTAPPTESTSSDDFTHVDPTTSESIPSPSPEPVPLRRSTRVSQLPFHLRDYHCYSAIASLHEPNTFSEAKSNPLWQKAMADEL